MLQAASGSYEVTEDEVRFIPRYRFLAGTSYAMVVNGAETLFIDRPAIGGAASTTVVAVYPSAALLPRNALRFYVHFSAPMSYGMAASHIHLERTDTEELVLGAFSPMDPELWDLDRQRLTVLLDPARIKQGLAPHREAGYPLREGITVTLAIGRGFLDAAGRPLVADHRQNFGVGPDIRAHIDPTDWVLSIPEAGGSDPVLARFDRPLDRALLERCLVVVGPEGLVVPGSSTVSHGEASWSFTPNSPWQQGRHQLLVDPVLEDLAGNSAVRVFDRDLSQPEHHPRTGGTISLPFVTVPGQVG